MPKFIIKNKIIVIILVILATLSITFLASPKIEKENTITTPLRPEVEAPLLEQGGAATATAGQGGGNSLGPKSIQETPTNTESATIIVGDTTAHLSFTPDTLFYDALIQARNKEQISFDGKDYISLGFFVTEIETLRAGEGKYLLYYINGQKASVGVSSYILQDGDVIEWKLE